MGDLFDDDDNSQDSSDFAQMFESSLGNVGKSLKPGDRIKGEILTIGKDEAFVSTGTIDDGIILRSELVDADGQLKHAVGEQLDCFVVQVRGSQILLSTKPTSKNIAEDLEDAFDMMLPIEGRVSELCNGGFRVNINGKTAFCPVSQMDIRRVTEPESYIGKKFTFMITQFSDRGRNIVVSRRKLLEEEKELTQSTFLDDHKVGDLIQGVVTRVERFGAFIEVVSGVEGLAHISELSWSRVTEPNEVVRVGQEVAAKILKFEEVNGRMNISLSLKQAQNEPWQNFPSAIIEGAVVKGRVTRCMKFGAFVEVAPGIEGLIPLSEMSDTKRVTRSDEIIKEGERIDVLVKEIRLEERRLTLSLKDAGAEMAVQSTGGRRDQFTPTGQANRPMGTLGDQLKGQFKDQFKGQFKGQLGDMFTAQGAHQKSKK